MVMVAVVIVRVDEGEQVKAYYPKIVKVTIIDLNPGYFKCWRK